MKPIRSLRQVIEDRKKEQEVIRESFKKKETFTLTGDKWEEFAEQLEWVNKNFLPTKIEKLENGEIIYY